MAQQPLDIRLAGFTVEKEGLIEVAQILNEITTKLAKPRLRVDERLLLLKQQRGAIEFLQGFTPETIAVAYARISRDPRALPELHRVARMDVEKSRKSFEAIAFTAGHKSIAEHAVFNFDLMGQSRLAVETIESKRLDSYTEQSQRYVLLDGDFIVPKELQETSFAQRFSMLAARQVGFYKEHLPKLVAWHLTQDYSKNFKSLGYENKPKKQQETIESYGTEDARYVLTVATQTQLGMTISARNLEVIISMLRSSPTQELIDIGNALFNEVEGIAPSVVKYTRATDYFQKTRIDLTEHVQDIVRMGKTKTPAARGDVKLFEHLSRDDSNLAGLIFGASKRDYATALAMVAIMSNEDKRALRDVAHKYQEKHDPKLRELELGDRVMELTMSSGAFGQMKRHRMNTLIPQRYDTRLSATAPPSFVECGLTREYNALVCEANDLYNDILEAGFGYAVAQYALMNGHKRRMLLDANNRQLHAFSAERENLPAQWDIRNVANDVLSLAKPTSPIMLEDACGKDRFYDVKNGEHN